MSTAVFLLLLALLSSPPGAEQNEHDVGVQGVSKQKHQFTFSPDRENEKENETGKQLPVTSPKMHQRDATSSFGKTIRLK